MLYSNVENGDGIYWKGCKLLAVHHILYGREDGKILPPIRMSACGVHGFKMDREDMQMVGFWSYKSMWGEWMYILKLSQVITWNYLILLSVFTCREFLPGQAKHKHLGSVENLRRNNLAALRSTEYPLTSKFSLSAVYSRHATLLPLRLAASPWCRTTKCQPSSPCWNSEGKWAGFYAACLS